MPGIERNAQFVGATNGYFYVRRACSPCSYAYAVAAARVDTPSLVKMLLTWRATVFSLMKSAAAIARFDLPEATRRTTSTSRADRPPVGLTCVPDHASTCAASGAAPRVVKAR